jgi:hypothetical protein
MPVLTDVLCYASAAGALAGAGAYVYGYIIKSKGERRMHTASLLFYGFGMANLPAVLRNGAQGPAVFNGAVVVTFLLLGIVCHSATALRRRRSDRRAEDRAQAPAPVPAPAPASAAAPVESAA